METLNGVGAISEQIGLMEKRLGDIDKEREVLVNAIDALKRLKEVIGAAEAVPVQGTRSDQMRSVLARRSVTSKELAEAVSAKLPIIWSFLQAEKKRGRIKVRRVEGVNYYSAK